MVPLTADIVEKLYTFLWPLTRIGAALMTAPLFATEAGNARLRIMLSLALSFMVYSLLEWPRLNPLSPDGLLALLNQIAIGIVMGLSLQVVVASLVIAGQAISSTMGLSMANLMDPTLGNVPVLSQFMLIIGSLVFLGAGGHLMLIGSLIDSFTLLPVGKSLFAVEGSGRMLAWSSMMFLGGVLIALPVMASLLLVNIGVGIMTRAAPSLNIFSVGLPAMMVAGYILIVACIGSMGGRIQWLWDLAFSTLREILGMA